MNKLDKYLQKHREQNRYDPRPDLTKDHEYWVAVLKQAEQEGNDTYGILHGFRCAGAKLVLKDNKLVMEPRLGKNNLWQSKEEYEDDKEYWLVPRTMQIFRVFTVSAATIKNKE